ncbi:DNA polymerase III subunit delta [Lentilactobacillus kosonis]|uniref:DNA polymerase III subunit delta n=1 Tax=Lentilactobacillus kosonis TaxID=2810561 RepID=A0A401FP03_9LACO|nr:DNA polymerase III subunit delta [Lentilactobacillus kosonis]GAY74125.1 DNA polymerase III delta subunit [Lentilactobacillus kosonis]
MNYSEFMRQIKNNPPAGVYLIDGFQDYLSDKIKQSFTQLIPEEERSMNLSVFDMEETSLSNAIEDAVSMPFFGEKRLVMINHPFFLTGTKKKSKIDHDVDELIEYINHPQESTIMVIFAAYDKLDSRKKITKQLKKLATVVSIGQPSENETKAIIKNEVAKAGCAIDDAAIDKLMELTSGNLTKMMNEIPKLTIYNNDTKRIDSKSVATLVPKSMEQNVFDLVNTVLDKQPTKSLEIYHQLVLESDNPIQINAVLIQQFRLLIQVMVLKQHGSSQGNISSSLKVHPYRVKLALQSIRRFAYEELTSAYLGLVNIEREMKSSSRSTELLFELFVVNFMKKTA